MAERTPNGTADLLADDEERPPESEATAAYTIDDEDGEDDRGGDPSGSNEREPSLITRLSTGASTDGIERKPSRQKEAALAEKTSKIMSDYQAYLSEIETEFPQGGVVNGEEEDAERNIGAVREAHRYRDDASQTFPPPVEGEYGEQGDGGVMYRGWSRGSDEGDARNRIHIDRIGGDFEGGMMPSGKGRATRLGSRRRVKRGLCMVGLVCAIVGLSVIVSNKKKQNSLPDWEAELAQQAETEALQNEEHMAELAELKNEEQMAELAEKEKIEALTAHSPNNIHPEMTVPGNDGQLTDAQRHEYQDVAEQFEPTFYDRTTGWSGRTYIDALSFCQEPNEYKDSRMRICPYIAICPGGQGSRPLIGHRNENGNQDILKYGGSWIPIIDGPNRWVSIGSDNSCVEWKDSHDTSEPEWGSTGKGNEANTRHLMCCDADAVEEIEEAIFLEEKKKEEEDKATTIAMSANAGSAMSSDADSSMGPSGITMAEDAGFQMSGSTQEEIAKMEQSGDLTKEEGDALPYVAAAEKFQPVFFDRDRGWSGSTYYEAVQFCESIEGADLHVCPFEAICPNGLGNLPIRTFVTEDNKMKWLPVSDNANSWVSVTRLEPCLPFRDQADWGDDTDNAMAMTDHLVCCAITNDTKDMVLGVADLDGTVSATTAADAVVADVIASHEEDSPLVVESEEFKEASDHAYETIAMTFEPLVFDRTSGWTGQTYLQALDFCAKSSSDDGERTICPLTAICPMGKGTDPITGPKDGPNGGWSWAPVSDDANSWVQVSSRDTCLPYEYIHDEKPMWGLNGQDDEEITRYLFCCLVSPPGTGSKSEAASSETNVVENGDSESIPVTPNPTPQSAGVTTETEEELYKTMAQLYEPLIYDRNSSPAWTGQAYLEALQFCASNDSRVPCPYNALCPAGKDKTPAGGIRQGYSPIVNHPNAWVSVGPENTCYTFSEVNDSPPEWGLTGEGDPDLTSSIACCLDLEDNKSEATSEAENSAESPEPLTEYEQVVMDHYKPEWFGRGAGYKGSSYLDAINFCNNVAGRGLCPVMAYCPNGPDSKLFLQLDPFEGEQWAPILNEDGAAEYVMIGTLDGDPLSTCETFESLTGTQTPQWGLDGTSTELKQQILCCHDPTYTSTGVITPTVEEDLNEPVAQTADSPTLEDGSFDLEGAVSLDLEPVWLDEEDGWGGGTHDDAEALCQQLVGKSLCPYAAYCPHGPGQPVIGGHDVDFKTQGIQWAPVYGAANHWILLSQKGGNSATTCMSHADLEGSMPDWGMTDERPWLKKHIMCCNLQNGF